MHTIAETATPMTTDMEALKIRLKAMWMDGNYDYFSRFMESSAVDFLERMNMKDGETLLDVACGSGQLALVAARRGIKATGVDIATNSILAARGRATSEGLDVRFDEGDAEDLPYAEARFDVVASLFGAMFAPRPEYVAEEMVRVCRPGGKVAMANWTKEGFIGQMFKTIARFAPPPAMPSPLLWGDEAMVRERLGYDVSDLRMMRMKYRFDYPFGPAEVVELFHESYGPAKRAFASLAPEERRQLSGELEALWTAHNLSSDGMRTIVDSEYLEVVGMTRTTYSLNPFDDDVLW